MTATNLSNAQSTQNKVESVKIGTSAKVTNALNKAKRILKKETKDKQVKLNTFDKFCTLGVDESSNNKDKQDAQISIDLDNSSNSN
eukprot:1381263-Ditylum_brightwellii.AAC.1